MKAVKNIIISAAFALVPVMGLSVATASAGWAGPVVEPLDQQLEYDSGWTDRCYTSFKDANATALRTNSNQNTVVATVTVPEGCAANYSVTTYETHQNRFPLSSQKAFETKSQFLNAGVHVISVDLPPQGCYYQADLYAGGPVLYNTESWEYYLTHLFDYKNGGTKDCLNIPPTTPPVTPPVTPTPPQTPAQPQPTTLVNTGPGSTVALFSLVTAGGYALHRVLTRKLARG